MKPRPTITKALALICIAGVGALVGFLVAAGQRPELPETSPEDQRPPRNVSAIPPSELRVLVGEDRREIATASPSELRSMWESTSSGDARSQIRRQLILARWAETDPQDGYDYFAENWAQLITFLVEWALISPRQLADHLPEERREVILEEVAKKIVVRSPRRFLDLVDLWLEISGREYKWPDYYMSTAFKLLAAEDSERAQTMAEGLPLSRRRHASLGIAAALSEQDPEAARGWAEGLGDPAERRMALGAVAVELAKIDPDAAAEMLKDREQPLRHGGPGDRILMWMVSDDPAAALAWVNRHFEDESETRGFAKHFARSAIQRLGEADTLALITSLDDTALRDRLIGALDTWAVTYDPSLMWTAVDALQDEPLRQQIRSHLFGRLVGDVSVAAAYLDQLPEDEVTPDLWEQLVDRASEDGFAGHDELFWKSVNKLPEKKQTDYLAAKIYELAASGSPEVAPRLDSFRNHAEFAELLQSAARGIWERDPPSARRWIETLDPELRGEAVASFATRIPGEQVAETYEWLQSLDLPPEDLKRATGWMVQPWAGQDGVSASRFILGLEPGPVRQEAIIALVWENHRLDPTAVLEWVEEIEDEQTRQKWRQRTETARRNTERVGER